MTENNINKGSDVFEACNIFEGFELVESDNPCDEAIKGGHVYTIDHV